ncbi:hypothetical protein BOTBODRAFT_124077 [Botryobasidium botryosum FD-172 SS1]|uniref:BTB domain-containing protein n=1 Tax=Botryobasidium botryosum (strain FD-172 SS1) TaxID=930990 RepID=A0A067N8L5_BOTB1|nr:hypothetical protein BOTBODRAFT_124077 [Botryobasidium botryosum FD-172 SS1]
MGITKDSNAREANTPDERSFESSPKISKRFSSPKADIILRSSDDVEFRVHRLFLAEASTVFRDMLEIPQAQTQSAGELSLPIVDVTESEEVLDALLRWIYPWAGKPKVTAVAQMESYLVAASKYDIAVVLEALAEGLKPEFVEKHPLGVYGMLRWLQITHQIHMPEAVSMARKHMIRSSFDLMNPPPSELNRLSAVDLLDLIKTKQAFRQVVEEIFTFNGIPRCNTCRKAGESTPLWWPKYRSNALAALVEGNLPDFVFSRSFMIAAVRSVDCEDCDGSFSNAHSQNYLILMKTKLLYLWENGTGGVYGAKLSDWNRT